jgi:hypothetical protein
VILASQDIVPRGCKNAKKELEMDYNICIRDLGCWYLCFDKRVLTDSMISTGYFTRENIV